ncbi:MAG: hypothetical protein EX271_07170 [Acidimicrobiales bacterium]|nr:hypothetical protein [Hyphomonadaceae bacterium]RZV41851.1 MAG: hypothetical protein EX271_07170 [Acidimicrobiales bacterium]
MHIRFLIGILAPVFLGIASIGANAEDADRIAWQSTETSISFIGSAVRSDMAGVPLDLELMTSSHDDAVGKVGFICMNGSFKAAIATKDTDLKTAMRHIWRRDHVIRGVKPRMTINGKSSARSVWTKSNRLGVALPQAKRASAQLYNAVIRQDEVYAQMSGMKKTRLILPPGDDTFAKFGAKCGMGVNANS